MNNQTQQITQFTLLHIFQSFKQQLKINALIKIMPQYLAQSLTSTSLQICFIQAFPYPKKQKIGQQDPGASNIALDVNANFRIQSEQPNQQDTKPNLNEQISEKMNKSIRKKRQSSLMETKIQKSELFALHQPVLPQQQLQLQKDLQAVKRNLYMMRKLKKQQQDEQNRRLEQSFNRKKLQPPTSNFTFDVSGQLLARKPLIFKKHLASPTLGKSQDVTHQIDHKQKALNNQTNYSDREFLISRGRNTSQSIELNRVLFGNQGKRQISHLPLIKLNQNIKLCQDPRSFKGPDSNRYALKSYQSRAQSHFKSYSEIQKDKSDRLYSLKRSSKQTEIIDDQVELKQSILTSSKKQSKRMQKYLKKLCEDRNKNFVVQINRSSNFDRLNSPHDYSVHRFYKHNFDDDKRSICELSLANLKLQNSRFFQQSTQIQ